MTFHGLDLQSELRALKEVAESDLPVLSAQNLQPLQNPEIASLLPLLLRLSARYRLNRLIQLIHIVIPRWIVKNTSHGVQLIEEKALSLLSHLCEENQQLRSRISSVPSMKSISLLQLLAFSAGDTVGSLSVEHAEYLQNSPLIQFIYKLRKIYYYKQGDPAEEFTPFLCSSYRLLVQSGFALSVLREPFVRRLDETVLDESEWPRLRHNEPSMTVGSALDELFRFICDLFSFAWFVCIEFPVELVDHHNYQNEHHTDREFSGTASFLFYMFFCVLFSRY